jgi:ABC-type Na+ efflux pump permease subunit
MLFRIHTEDTRRRRYRSDNRPRIIRDLEDLEALKDYFTNVEKEKGKPKEKKQGMDTASVAVLFMFLFPFVGAGQFYAYALVIRSAMDMLRIAQ